MLLSPADRDMLAGVRGAGAAKAMNILAALGRIHNAPDMADVKSVQVSGISYKNIGPHGLGFLEEWAGQGSKTVVPSFMNPGGNDRRLWKELGFSADFVEKQSRVIAALEKLGVEPTLTCTPYHTVTKPAFGDHLAWAESSAVAYANSVLGARTNREGGPSALAAALTGRTPRHGLHTDAGRMPTRSVRVNCKVLSTADAGALGAIVGKALAEDGSAGVPYLLGVEPPEGLRRDAWLKALGAAMAAFGSTALFHIDGVTPEAKQSGPELLKAAKREMVIDSLEDGLKSLHRGGGKIDVVAVGCPHASLDDISYIHGLLKNRKAKIPVWIFTSEAVRVQVDAQRLSALRELGVKIVADTCIVVAPLKDIGIKNVAIDSAKSACYLPSHQQVGLYYASTEELVETAVRGEWKAGK
ncbi:MAG: aconitase X catalytic domain-containing protein [Elusimicrobiota bacterium]